MLFFTPFRLKLQREALNPSEVAGTRIRVSQSRFMLEPPVWLPKSQLPGLLPTRNWFLAFMACGSFHKSGVHFCGVLLFGGLHIRGTNF